MTDLSPTGFLAEPTTSPAVKAAYDEDVEDYGYVMNLSRVWAHDPSLREGLFALIGRSAAEAGLTFRQRGVLVTACASTLGDAYCSLAWGGKLAGEVGTDGDLLAAGVLTGDDALLDDAERALARWARQVTADPNGAGAADVAALRDAGYDDRQILAVTCFVALRLAFSTVNDALGARPDAELVAGAPEAVRAAVTYGRPPAD